MNTAKSTVEDRNQIPHVEVTKKSRSSLKTRNRGGLNRLRLGKGMVKEVGSVPSEENSLPRMRPEATVQLYDFHDKPLQGRDSEEVGREFGVKVEILLAGEKDPWRKAYTIRISGSTRAVQTFVGKYQSSPRYPLVD